MSAADTNACLASAIELLEGLKIPHLLMGALALAFYGEGRATRDVDLMLGGGDPETLSRVRLEACERGFCVDQEWAEAYPDIHDVQMRLSWHGIPVDLMLPRDDHDRSACQRRRSHPMGPRSVWVMAPEDLILQKLKVGRPRDFDDVIPFFVQHRDQLDHSYLNEWALRLGVREELDYLWSQSGEG